MVQALRDSHAQEGGRTGAASGIALHPLVRAGGDRLLVFVHDAGIDASKIIPILTQRLVKAGFHGPSYLLAWQGEPPAGRAAMGVLGQALSGLATRGPSLVLAGMRSAAAPAVRGAGMSLSQSQRHVPRAAQGLVELVGRLPGIADKRISFMGYSMGAEVVRAALGLLQPALVKDVVLVAGATGTAGWLELAKRLRGRLVNFHSASDAILKALPTEVVGGAAGMPAVSPGVVNVVAPGWDHDTYWQSLETVLKKAHDLIG